MKQEFKENKDSEFLEIAGYILITIIGFVLFFGGLSLYIFWDVAIGPPPIHSFIAVLIGLPLLIIGPAFLKKETLFFSELEKIQPCFTKTKIAAWWMRVGGILAFLFVFFFILSGGNVGAAGEELLCLLIGIVAMILFIPISYSIFRAKKQSWIESIILILISVLSLGYFILHTLSYYIENYPEDFSSFWDIIIFSIRHFPLILPFLLLLFPPLILLLLDRKNFFKIAK